MGLIFLILFALTFPWAISRHMKRDKFEVLNGI